MFKQVIIWTLQDKCFGPNLRVIKGNIKERFEELNGNIPGLNHIEVHSDCMSSSNGDVILMADFDDEASLKSKDSNELWNTALNEAVIPFIDETRHVEYSA